MTPWLLTADCESKDVQPKCLEGPCWDKRIQWEGDVCGARYSVWGADGAGASIGGILEILVYISGNQL